MTFRYSPEERRQFAAAMGHVPGLRDRAGRDLVIANLEAAVGQPLDLVREPDDGRDVANLADLCLRRPELVPPLLDVLNAAGRSPELVELNRLADRFAPPTVLTFTERRELLSLMAGMEEKELPRLYAAAVGPLGPPPTQPVEKASLLYDLEDTMPDPGSLLPLLLFAELLADELDRAAAGALRAWTDAVGGRLGLDRQLAAARQSAEPLAIPERRYLTVELVPDALSYNQFMLTAWLQDSSGRRLSALSSPDRPILVSQIAGPVQDLLNRAAAMAADLTVEFIIPYALLDFPFEQLTYGSKAPVPIGAVFPVLVRSLERLRDAFFHPQWRRKWTQLQRESGAGSVLWLERPGEASQHMLPRLEADDTLCVVQAYRPRGDHEEMRAAVLSGVPAIVWNRDGLPPTDFARQVRMELFRDGPLGLPGHVRRVRREALSSPAPPDHLGRCVALLWDDPSRLPEPELRLRAPDNRLGGN